MKRYAKYFGGSMLALGIYSAMTADDSSETQKAEPQIIQTEKDGAVSNRYFRYGASNIPHPSK